MSYNTNNSQSDNNNTQPESGTSRKRHLTNTEVSQRGSRRRRILANTELLQQVNQLFNQLRNEQQERLNQLQNEQHSVQQLLVQMDKTLQQNNPRQSTNGQDTVHPMVHGGQMRNHMIT